MKEYKLSCYNMKYSVYCFSEVMGVSHNSQNRGVSLTAARYTIKLWVLYVLPFVSGLIITNFYAWSYFWPILLLTLTIIIIVFNLTIVLQNWYHKPISRWTIIIQMYAACFFGTMLFGKALGEVSLYFVLGFIFLINALLGYYYRKNITSCGFISRTLLIMTTFFPIAFAWFFWDSHSSSSMFLEPPSMISSISLGLTYFCGVIVESLYRF